MRNLQNVCLSRGCTIFFWLLFALVFKIFAKSRIPYGVRGDEIDKVDISEVSDDIWIEIGG